MKTLKFYGASDDLFEMDGDESEEWGCYNRLASVLVEHDGERLLVVGLYDGPGDVSDGCWAIGVQLFREGDSVPPWPVRLETHNRKYSPVLVLEVPDGATVSGVSDDCDD